MTNFIVKIKGRYEFVIRTYVVPGCVELGNFLTLIENSKDYFLTYIEKIDDFSDYNEFLNELTEAQKPNDLEFGSGESLKG